MSEHSATPGTSMGANPGAAAEPGPGRETGAGSATTAPPPVLLKLGGALITDKAGREAVRPETLARLAAEIGRWWHASGGGLIIGHGSGSFGHAAAVSSGFVDSPRDAMAFSQVAAAAARLNAVVVAALLDAGVPAVGVPGGLLAHCTDGVVTGIDHLAFDARRAAGIVPVTYGDVALDTARGAAVASTDALLAALAKALRASRVVFATDVDGIFTCDPNEDSTARPLPTVSPGLLRGLELGGARSGVTDVTGGMASKALALIELVGDVDWRPEVRIVSGHRPGALEKALDGRAEAGGTLLVRDA